MTFPVLAPISRRGFFIPFFALVMLLAVGLAGGCAVEPATTGTFEKTLKVDGPVRLEVANGAGEIEILAGPSGQVQVRGDYRISTMLFGRTQRRANELRDNPPIQQSGSVINIGLDTQRLRNVTINYRITVPAETVLRARAGSGNIEARGIKGPARLSTGSGDIAADTIGDEVEASTGSGDITLSNVSGPVVAKTGAGDMQLSNVRGAIRTRTGSGDITVSRPGDRAQITTGSGEIHVSDAASDVRISTASGDITISGNPSPQSYWELHASSGEITIDVPETASFRIHARTNSGALETDIPITIEEKSRRMLRARAGSGDARIDAETTSGSIRIR